MSLKMNVTMNVEGYEEVTDDRDWHYRIEFVDYMRTFRSVGTCEEDPTEYDFAGEWRFANYHEAEAVAEEMNKVGADHFGR